MMQIRYPNRFTADLDIDCDMEDMHIPRMLLQPILENSIVHGFANETGHHLTLKGSFTGDKFEFIIKDDGCGMTEEAYLDVQGAIEAITPTSHAPHGLHQIALANIQKRVVADFGVGFGLTIASQLAVGTTVTLTIPTRRNH